MSWMLATAAVLTVGIGIAHSWLGERYLLVRLLRRADLPPLLGGVEFTQGIIRFAWHLTTVAWWGLAAVLVFLSGAVQRVSVAQGVLWSIAGTFAASAILTMAASRGRHLAWVVFGTIAVLCVAAAGVS
jgi:hypothetical protein